MGGIYGTADVAARQLKARLDKLPRAIAKEAARELNEVLRDQATNETDAFGQKFAPLKASTLRRKRKSLGGPIILTRTNAMWNGSYVKVSGGKIVYVLGAAAQYAQNGDSGRGNRPPRMILSPYGLTKAQNAAIKRAADTVAKRGAK